jgi:hypothetical protein
LRFTKKSQKNDEKNLPGTSMAVKRRRPAYQITAVPRSQGTVKKLLPSKQAIPFPAGGFFFRKRRIRKGSQRGRVKVQSACIANWTWRQPTQCRVVRGVSIIRWFADDIRGEAEPAFALAVTRTGTQRWICGALYRTKLARAAGFFAPQNARPLESGHTRSDRPLE